MPEFPGEKSDSSSDPKAEIMTIEKVIGTAAKMRRMKLGLSLDQVCDRVNGVSKLNWPASTLSRVESGGRKLRVGELAMLCFALECTASDLMDAAVKLDETYPFWTAREFAVLLTESDTGHRAHLDFELEVMEHDNQKEQQLQAQEMFREVNEKAQEERAAQQAIADAKEMRLSEELQRNVMRALGVSWDFVSDRGQVIHGNDEKHPFNSLVFRMFARSLFEERESRVEEVVYQMQQDGVWREGMEKQLRAEATRNMMTTLRNEMDASGFHA